MRGAYRVTIAIIRLSKRALAVHNADPRPHVEGYLVTDAKRVRLRRVLSDLKAVPKPLLRGIWTRVGADVQLDLGHCDLHDLREVITGGVEEGAVDFIVTDRFVLSPQAALDLLETFQDIVKDLQQQGLLPPEGEKH